MKLKKLNFKKYAIANKAMARDRGAGKHIPTSLPAEELVTLSKKIAQKIAKLYFYSFAISKEDIAGEIACYVLEEGAMGVESLPISKLYSRGIKEARRQLSLLAMEEVPSSLAATTANAWWDIYDFSGMLKSIPEIHREIIGDVLYAVLYDGLKLVEAFHYASTKYGYTNSYIQKLFYKYTHKHKSTTSISI